MREASRIYPLTPDGWTEVARHRIGPFTTHVTFRKPDGEEVHWSSRAHRKHHSAASFASWWISVLFAIGSACFVVAPFPGFEQLTSPAADGITFFVGSIFFTSAAYLQYLEAANADEGPIQKRKSLRFWTWAPGRIDWVSSVVQLIGTLCFNVSTFLALKSGLDVSQTNRLVWAPDAFGSVFFLVAGTLAYAEVRGGFSLRHEPSLEWTIGAVNLLGCVLFGISAIASFIVPSTGSIVDLAASNVTTSLGAICFGIGALLLLPEGASARRRIR